MGSKAELSVRVGDWSQKGQLPGMLRWKSSYGTVGKAGRAVELGAAALSTHTSHSTVPPRIFKVQYYHYQTCNAAYSVCIAGKKHDARCASIVPAVHVYCVRRV